MKRQEEKNIFKNPKLKRLLSIAVSFQSYPDRYTNDKNILEWKRSDVTSDIVMLKLKTPLTLNDFVQKICLPPPEFKADRKVVKSDQTKSPVCLITGWGHTEGSGNNANLQQATVPVRRHPIPCRSIFCRPIPRRAVSCQQLELTFRYLPTIIVMNYLEMACYQTSEIFVRVFSQAGEIHARAILVAH